MAHITFHSPVGELTLIEEDGALVALEWGRAPKGDETALLTRAKNQIDAYFDRKRHDFDLPLKPKGTPFQQRVWARMSKIGFGATETYGALAHDLDSGPRAVANACGRNPLPILIPCHRVVGARGALGGYSGEGGVDTKRRLLTIEGGLIL